MEEKILTTYVRGMYCAQCPQIIISSLLQKRGVLDADAAYFRAQVSVKYDPEIISGEDICTALNDMGYPPFDRKPTLSEQLVDKISHLFG